MRGALRYREMNCYTLQEFFWFLVDVLLELIPLVPTLRTGNRVLLYLQLVLTWVAKYELLSQFSSLWVPWPPREAHKQLLEKPIDLIPYYYP